MNMQKLNVPKGELDSTAASRWPRRRPIVLAVLLIAAALAAGWWFLGRGTAVTAIQATRGSAAEIVYATGAVEPERWARVATLVTGRIIERCRCEGQAVEAGDLLARLDDAEPQAALAELHARERFARAELQRQNQLMERGIATPQEHDRATAELQQVQGMISVQRERISNYRLLAPMDGIVLREDGEVGEIVTSNTILYQIGFPKPLLLIGEVNEEDIPRVEVGQTVLLRSDAFTDRRLTGTVRDITPAGDPIARTFRVRVALPDDTPLRIGMSVEANIITREVADALLVPAAAISQDAVYVVEDARAVHRPVEIGIRGPQTVEILDGLQEGEDVISPVPPDIRDGMRVRLQAPRP